jgi:hypothetical protein
MLDYTRQSVKIKLDQLYFYCQLDYIFHFRSFCFIIYIVNVVNKYHIKRNPTHVSKVYNQVHIRPCHPVVILRGSFKVDEKLGVLRFITMYYKIAKTN